MIERAAERSALDVAADDAHLRALSAETPELIALWQARTAAFRALRDVPRETPEKAPEKSPL
jgi:hypothetical protein